MEEMLPAPKSRFLKLEELFVPRGRRAWIIFWLSFLAALVVTLVGVKVLNKEETTLPTFSPGGISDILEGRESSPTPFPFWEMTIPYLSSRTYGSVLGELNQAAQTTDYTSYLTSFDSDGLKVNGLLTTPSGEVPEGGFAAIVFLHGYIPPSQYQTTTDYAAYVDYLARNGFVVFKIDLRGNGNSEGEASGAYYSGDYIIDTLNARAALISSGFVNPDKVGLWGHSMAGNVAFRALAAQGDIGAVVIWAGAVYTYSDWEDFGISDNSYSPPRDDSERQRKRDALFEMYGRFSEDSDFWKQVPGTNYLSNIKGALQIHHAINDNVVDIGYSRNLMSFLDSTGIEHELFEYGDGGHNISGNNFNLAMQRTVEFFRQNLN